MHAPPSIKNGATYLLYHVAHAKRSDGLHDIELWGVCHKIEVYEIKIDQGQMALTCPL